MKIRVEPFVGGFMTGMKAQMDALDHEFFRAVFKGHVTSKFASSEEKNPAKASHYFRFGASHLNVLLPTWLLNQKSAMKTDRFRIATTDDHSFILDTKESIIYDPTSENLHKQIEHSAFWLSSDWRDEARLRFSDELQQKRLKIFVLGERAEHLPEFYKEFTAFVARHRLKSRTPALRLGLSPRADETSQKVDDLMMIALEELHSRRKAS
jgi:hypothetical protein